MEKANKRRLPVLEMVRKLLRTKWFQLLFISVIVVVAVYNVDHGFLSRGNVRNILRGMVVPGIMMVAVGPLLAGGGIDLAAASQATLASVLFAKLMVYMPGMPWGVAAIITLTAGAVFGLINVLLINGLNFLAFIATISMSTIFQGITQMWTGMYDITVRNESITNLGKISIINDWVPVLFIIMLALVALYVYMMANTRFGRSIYMVGGNPTAARLAGINPKKVKAILFINSGIMSALAGIAWSAQNKMAHPTAISTNAPNFTALTAVIIGGVSFNGGSGTLAAGFFGMVIVRLFENGLMMLGFRSYVNVAAQGLILIVALITDHISAVRQRKALNATAMSTVYKKAN